MIMIEDKKIRTIKFNATELQILEDSLIQGNTYAMSEFYGKIFKDLLNKVRDAKNGAKKRKTA